VNELDKWTRCF